MVAVESWKFEKKITNKKNIKHLKNVCAFFNLLSTCGFIVVNVNSFELKIGIAIIRSSWVDTMFIWDNFPKLKKKIIFSVITYWSKN